ncbi:magnesium transporter NIPA [Tanacetum coccineum]
MRLQLVQSDKYGTSQLSQAFWCFLLVLIGVLIFRYVSRYGQTHLIVYVGICFLMGLLTVMCVKEVAIAINLSFSGSNQFILLQTCFFTLTFNDIYRAALLALWGALQTEATYRAALLALWGSQ